MKVRLILLIIFFSISCNKLINNSPCINTAKNLANLQGEWIERLDTSIGYFGYELVNLKIKNDSFKLKIEFYDDLLNYSDPCDLPTWTEYASGLISVLNNQLVFNGVYTDSLFRSKSSGCNNVGVYKKTIPDVALLCDSLVFFNAKMFDKNSSYREFGLKKK